MKDTGKGINLHYFLTAVLFYPLSLILHPLIPMRSKTYRGHSVEFDSEEMRAGEWFARATIVIVENKKAKRIPIFGRRRATFETRRQADAYVLELAKMWIDGRTWGTNGHG
jgi:hypothetical protein